MGEASIGALQHSIYLSPRVFKRLDRSSRAGPDESTPTQIRIILTD